MKKLTETEILKIKQLNFELQQEEARIKSFADKLSVVLEQQKQEKLIDNYIFSSSISVFSNNASVYEKYGIDCDNPIFEDGTYCLFQENQSNSFFEEDWNEWKTVIPLEKERMCYTMHSIIDHSKLTFEDVLTIDQVWIKLHVEYLFYVE